MSSADEDTAQLKGGHAPAVKVAGGMRISQSKPKPDSDDKSNTNEKQEEGAGGGDGESTVASPSKNQTNSLLLSGTPANLDRDFPEEAVKATHTKPLPTVQANHAPPVRHIQQPRKI